MFSHGVTLDLKMRDGLKKGMCYKPEVCISPREYSVQQTLVETGITHVILVFCATVVAQNTKITWEMPAPMCQVSVLMVCMRGCYEFA